MNKLVKQAFANGLKDFMQADRIDWMRKHAAPMPPGMFPPDMPMPDQGAGGQPDAQQGGAQIPQETLNIQAKGPEAIDAIKSMMGNSGMQPTPDELAQQLPPEVLANMQYQMPPKMASFKNSLGSFMRADRADYLNKRAALNRREASVNYVKGLIRSAAGDR